MMKATRRLLIASAAAATLLVNRSAFAQNGFLPSACTPCSFSAESIDWSWAIGGSGSELPYDPNQSLPYVNYENYIRQTRYVVANAYVKKFWFNTVSFATEACCDYLDYGPNGYLMTRLKGTPTLGFRSIEAPDSLQTTPARFRFVSDGSMTASGVNLSGGLTCCSTTPSDALMTFPINQRVTGFLLGPQDVVYMAFPAAPNQTHETMTFWGDPSGGNDFDVFVRCNAKPTYSVYDYAAATSSAQEYLHISNAEVSACSGTWYVAVYSYRTGTATGRGAFNIVWSQHKTQRHRYLRAGTDFAASAAELSQIEAQLSAAAKYFYGATEGVDTIVSISLYNNASSGGSVCNNCGGDACNVCYRKVSGRSSASLCNSAGVVEMRDEWRFGTQPLRGARTLAHEWGHQFLCLIDEYCGLGENIVCGTGGLSFLCGHSLMGAATNAYNQYNLCTDFDHLTDSHKAPIPDYSPAFGQGSAWGHMNASGATNWLPSDTPDNFSYATFDFKGLIGGVNVYP